MTYTPRSIDTSGIELPAELEPLGEKLAEHNHDVWAQQRISEGWTFGEKRNDDDLTHPDLVPYEQLSDSEKQYDRNSVEQVLKAIVALGYRIGKD